MATRVAQVKTYIEYLTCPACNADMEFLQEVRAFARSTYQHRCPRCGMIDEAKEKFPVTRYEEIRKDVKK